MADDTLFREELDNKYLRSIETTVKDLKSFALSNFEYYKAFDDDCSMRFVKSTSFLLEYVSDGLVPGLGYVLTVGRMHDYSQNCPGNGYRSLVKLVERCCYHILTLVRYISSKRSSVFFRHNTHGTELEAFVNMLGQLKACLHYAHKYSRILKDKLVVEDFDPSLYGIMFEIENLSQEPFFGHCLGFQFCQSMQQPLNMMHLMLACYSEGFNKATAFMKVASSLLHSGKFYLSPELRSKKVVSATIDGDITFCKSFWSLSENNLVHNLTKFVSPTVALETTFNIPTDPVQVCLSADPHKSITVCASSAHGDPLPIPVRLISYTQRKGQLKSHSSKPPSDSLIIHCHGGGFVAQSSLSHASYLRHWAKDLDVPIISIDYSLAPEFAYPRQVEEIFFAYCWILNNLEVLGSTGKTIVWVGDSAGANLVLCTALRTLEKGIRKPDGVLCVYGCFLVRYSPTPSRLLALCDPILPLGNLTNCLAAYIGIDVRLREDLYKKKRLQRQQKKQMLEHKNDLENENKNNEDNDPNKSINENLQSKAKRNIRKFFRNNTYDFMKKQTRVSFKKTSKSCEFEDISLGVNSYRKFNSFRTQLSTDAGLSKASDLRLSGSEKTLRSDVKVADDDMNDNKSNTPSGGDESLATVHERKGVFVVRSRNDDENENSRNEMLACMSEDYMTAPTSSTDSMADSSTTTFKDATSTQSTLSNSQNTSEATSDEERMMKEAEQEMRKLKEATYPDSAIIGHRKILLDMKGLKRQLERTKDMYLSPVFAPDSALKQLNCISFVGLHLDPLLDESVHMAKRFKAVGAQVSLDLVDDLPHGFLNFMHLSKEAYQAAILCGLRLKRLIVAGNRNRLTSESSLSSLSAFKVSDMPIDVCTDDFPSMPSTPTKECPIGVDPLLSEFLNSTHSPIPDSLINTNPKLSDAPIKANPPTPHSATLNPTTTTSSTGANIAEPSNVHSVETYSF